MPRQSAMGVVGLLLLLLGGLVVLRSGGDANSPAGATAQSAASTAARSNLMRDSRGCLLPAKTFAHAADVEPAASSTWQAAAAAGARLAVDDCGSVWALWFNSWDVFVEGNLLRTGSVQLPTHGEFADLAHAGVSSFLIANGELWALVYPGDVLRFRDQHWQRLPATANCFAGQLHRHLEAIWLACGGNAATALQRWDERAGAWLPQGEQLNGPSRLANDQAGNLYAYGAGQLAVYRPGPEQDWQVLSEPKGDFEILRADRHRLVLAGERGMVLLDTQGQQQWAALAQTPISAVILSGDDELWVGVRNSGLRYFDGEHWFSWRYADGLPSDEARDLLLDAEGRLWLAGSPMARMDVDRAREAIRALPPIESLPAQRFDNACLAARQLIRGQSGAIASVDIDGVQRVFFRDRQVCPNPWQGEFLDGVFWRRDDGALVQATVNGARGHSDCDAMCRDESLRRFQSWWTFTIHAPDRTVPAGWQRKTLPWPEPLPSQTPAYVLLARNGDLWVSTRDRGIWQYHGESWRHHDGDDGFNRENIVSDLAEDAFGAIWVSSYPTWRTKPPGHQGQPLHRYENGNWRHWPVEQLPTSSLGPMQARPDAMLIAGNGDLLRIAADQPEKTDRAERQGVATRGLVQAMFVDDDDRIWLGHHVFREGLSVHVGGRRGFLSTREGLFADALVAVAGDDQNRLWLISVEGEVAVYDQQSLLEAMRWEPAEGPE